MKLFFINLVRWIAIYWISRVCIGFYFDYYSFLVLNLELYPNGYSMFEPGGYERILGTLIFVLTPFMVFLVDKIDTTKARRYLYLAIFFLILFVELHLTVLHKYYSNPKYDMLPEIIYDLKFTVPFSILKVFSIIIIYRLVNALFSRSPQIYIEARNFVINKIQRLKKENK